MLASALCPSLGTELPWLAGLEMKGLGGLEALHEPTLCSFQIPRPPLRGSGQGSCPESQPQDEAREAPL